MGSDGHNLPNGTPYTRNAIKMFIFSEDFSAVVEISNDVMFKLHTYVNAIDVRVHTHACVPRKKRKKRSQQSMSAVSCEREIELVFVVIVCVRVVGMENYVPTS